MRVKGSRNVKIEFLRYDSCAYVLHERVYRGTSTENKPIHRQIFQSERKVCSTFEEIRQFSG